MKYFSEKTIHSGGRVLWGPLFFHSEGGVGGFHLFARKEGTVRAPPPKHPPKKGNFRLLPREKSRSDSGVKKTTRKHALKSSRFGRRGKIKLREDEEPLSRVREERSAFQGTANLRLWEKRLVAGEEKRLGTEGTQRVAPTELLLLYVGKVFTGGKKYRVGGKTQSSL